MTVRGMEDTTVTVIASVAVVTQVGTVIVTGLSTVCMMSVIGLVIATSKTESTVALTDMTGVMVAAAGTSDPQAQIACAQNAVTTSSRAEGSTTSAVVYYVVYNTPTRSDMQDRELDRQ